MGKWSQRVVGVQGVGWEGWVGVLFDMNMKLT